MLAPPAVLDLCALYGRSNLALVVGLLGSLGQLDGGAVGIRLAEGLEKSGVAAARALADVHAKVPVMSVYRSVSDICRDGKTFLFMRRYIEQMHAQLYLI